MKFYEEEPDLGVEDGAHVGDAAEEVEVEEDPGQDEHEDGGRHHGRLIALVHVRGCEVGDEQPSGWAAVDIDILEQHHGWLPLGFDIDR